MIYAVIALLVLTIANLVLTVLLYFKGDKESKMKVKAIFSSNKAKVIDMTDPLQDVEI